MNSFVISGTAVEGSGSLSPRADRFRSIAGNLIDRLAHDYGSDIKGSFMLVDGGVLGNRWIATSVKIEGLEKSETDKMLVYDNQVPNGHGVLFRKENPYPYSRGKVTRVDFEPIEAEFHVVNRSHLLQFVPPTPLMIGSLVHHDLDTTRYWAVSALLANNDIELMAPSPDTDDGVERMISWKGRLYPVLF